MALKLFSKSSKTQKEKDASLSDTAPLPGSDAGPEELAEAAKSAKSAKDRLLLVSRITDTKTLKDLSQATGCLVACADQLANLESIDAALSTASSPASRFEIAIHTHNTRLREAQIAQITQESELVELEHASRSKNKTCNRMTRERLDLLRGARLEAAESAELAQTLAQSAKQLEDDEHLAARYDALAQKHRAATDQHKHSEELLKEFKASAPALTPMPAPPTTAILNPADEGPNFQLLSSEFSELAELLTAGSKAQSLSETMTRASESWREAIAQATPNAHDIDKVANASKLYETLLNSETLLEQRTDAISALLADAPALNAKTFAELPRAQLGAAWQQRELAKKQTKEIAELTKGLRYPDSVAIPKVLDELSARRTELKALLDAAQITQKKTEEQFREQVKRLGQALDAGELKRAEAARGEARALQDALPGGAASDTRKRYGALIANMQNLRDWQHFATDPKREELCEQMTTLADSPKDPEEQADLVKALRAQWNALGGKGPKEIASRFDEAAARAFEPCRLHYATLAESRAKNLEIRKGILAQLEEFVSATDWASADLAGARNILNSARTEWRNAFPVERGANRNLEKAFKAATDTLYEHLQEGWSENLAAKEKLVATAEALLESEDPLPGRLDAAKRLQQDWKKAGPVPRGPDQKLWKRFRTACDTLFNARDEERTQLQAEYSAQQVQAQEKLDAFEKQLAATQPQDLERSLFKGLKQELDELPNLDRGVIKRARDLEDQFMAKLKQKAAAKQAKALKELLELDQLVAKQELAGEPISAELLERDQRFGARKKAAETAHLDLVLEAETQAGIESPAENSQRRLELQVLKLNAGMNSGARKATGGMELIDQWCTLEANASSEPLRDRLFTAAQSLL